MQIVYAIAFLLIGYLLGSIPTGLIIVKIGTGKDVRKIESGRTGGTNAYRAAGFWAGILTGFFDGFKGCLAVWLALWVGTLTGDIVYAPVLAGIGAILGHNYSIFLAERTEGGKIRLRGGAGGATAAGAAIGLWFPNILILPPLLVVILVLTGYASVTTMAVPLLAAIIFAIRAYLGLTPWSYVLFGIVAELIIVWALRPNIKRLMQGTERMVGPRAKRRAAKLEGAHEEKSPE